MSSGQEVGEIFGEGSGPAMSLLRSPTVIIAAVGLWGMNVYLFRLFGIDYVHVLTLDLIKEKKELTITGGDGENNHSEGEDLLLCHVVSPPSTPSPRSTIKSPHQHRRTSSGDGNNNSSGVNNGSSNTDGEVTAGKLITFSLLLLILLHISTVIWIDCIGGSTIGAIFIFYVAVLVGILLPLPSTSWIRKAFMTIFHRTFELIHPRCFCCASNGVVPRAIPFVDVFFADACCSLSKVFFDWGMLWHMAWHYPEPVPMELHSIIIPSLAASLPYLIRARQCLVMYSIGSMKSDTKKYQHMVNAIKYSTSLWPLVVSAYQKTTMNDEEKAALETFLIILLAINSTYSLAWDVIMDWGMMQNNPHHYFVPDKCVAVAASVDTNKLQKSSSSSSCAQSVLRPTLRFGASTSIAILLIDVILRYSWLLRFWESDLFPNADIYILCTQFLEAIRRSLWNLLRVEWEHIKQNKGKEEEVTMTAGGGEDVEMVEQKKPFLVAAPTSHTMNHPKRTSVKSTIVKPFSKKEKSPSSRD